MSAALYDTRLLWNGHAGLAKHDGVLINLRGWPPAAVRGTDVAEIDFAPEVRACTVREHRGAWREMTGAEWALAREWLAGMSAAAWKFINSGTTP